MASEKQPYFSKRAQYLAMRIREMPDNQRSTEVLDAKIENALQEERRQAAVEACQALELHSNFAVTNDRKHVIEAIRQFLIAHFNLTDEDFQPHEETDAAMSCRTTMEAEKNG